MRVMRSLRDRMPSLSKMCPRWNSTVLTLTYSSAAVCRLDRPAATSRATACSAGVRPGSAGAVCGPAGAPAAASFGCRVLARGRGGVPGVRPVADSGHGGRGWRRGPTSGALHYPHSCTN